MSKRHPTAEEILLWREINRTTHKNPDIVEEPLPAPTSAMDATPALIPRRAPTPAAIMKPATRPKPPLNPLSSREAKKRLNLHTQVDARLDLHGYSRLDAYALVQAFIAYHARAGDRHLIIIPGKGRSGEGILRNELPHWLNEPAQRRHIAAFFNAAERDGGAGVVHVMLTARKDA